MTIPPWISRAFARCESCCLDNQEDRERLASVLVEELDSIYGPKKASPALNTHNPSTHGVKQR
jgi:hypothetical protein